MNIEEKIYSKNEQPGKHHHLEKIYGKFSVAPGSPMNTRISICQPHSSTPQLERRTVFLLCVRVKDGVAGLTPVISAEVSIHVVIQY